MRRLMKINSYKLRKALLDEALRQSEFDEALNVKDNFRVDAAFAITRLLASVQFNSDMSLSALEEALYHIQNAISKIKS